MTSDVGIAEGLADQLQTSAEGVAARLRTFEHEWACEGKPPVTARVHYLSFGGDGAATFEHFVKFLTHQVVPYSLPPRLIREARERYEVDNQFSHMQELMDQTKRLLVKAQGLRKKSGEPGEVLLFILLEALLGAPQIASKMYLSTNSNQQVYGSDGVHMRYEEETSTLVLYWGESKLFANVNSAISKAAESMATFLKSVDGAAPRDRDIDVIKQHIHVEDVQLRDALLSYFNPYSEDSNNIVERFACLIGFSYSAYSGTEDAFRTALAEAIPTACDEFVKRLREQSMEEHEFELFLVPIPSVKDLRTAFYSVLGIAPQVEG